MTDADLDTAEKASARAGTRYWRSVERLLDSPGVDSRLSDRIRAEIAAGARGDGRDWVEREFPVGASEAPKGVTRRAMLGLMGASFGLAGLTACRRPVEHIVPYVHPPEGRIVGLPERYASTMPLGTHAVGVVVESHEGRPTKIEGNELHPASAGAASTWMQAAILDLYDPDRARAVAHRAAADSGDSATSGGSSQAAETSEAATWKDFRGFWGKLAGEAGDGSGVAVLSEAWASPTMARLAGRFAERFPEARWVVWEPAGEESVIAGIEQATGHAARPLHHFGRARTILTLDADPLLTEGEAMAHARGFARGSKPDASGRMNRLYAVEPALSVTGANADHRVRLAASKVGAFAAELARRLGAADAPAPAGGDLPEAAHARIGLIADDLRAAGPGALVIAGRRQPPAVHALVHRIHEALGAVGTTVTLGELGDTAWGRMGDLTALTRDMAAGKVKTLVVLGGNPAYDTPGELDFAGALGKVEHVVHLTSRPDETSSGAEWVLPRCHFLEAWGDARSADGTASVIQPLVAPLFDSKSDVEVLGMLLGETAADDPSSPKAGYDLVRETWGAGAPEAIALGSPWRKILHDGVAPEGAGPAPVSAGAAAATGEPAPQPPAASGGVEVVFLLSPSVHDGRWANNAWLQEQPDPLTRISWGNAALVSRATAEGLGVDSGDVVRLTAGDRSIEAPVWVQPGTADGTVAIELGFGRTAAGRVGTGVGVDAYPLVGAHAGLFATGVQVAKTGRRETLAQTQEHWSMEGRDVVREATLAEYRAKPEMFRGEAADEPPAASHQAVLWKPPQSYAEGHQWAMTIDLASCIGCNACVAACQAENNVPVVGKKQVANGREMLWLRVDRYFAGPDEAEPEVVFQTVPCMHCENAPCEEVCPVAATVHDEEGLNAMVYNRCIGTRYCSNNCPYKVRRFNFFNYTKDLPDLVQLAMNPEVTVRSRGVMEKCTYCVQRIEEGKLRAKRANRNLRDGEIQTACQQTCPAQAITFGDKNDPESRVTQERQDPRNYTLLAELNNRPRTTYQGKLRNPNPKWGKTA